MAGYLGNITWNFDKLSMEFYDQGRKHVMRGASQPRVKTIRNQQLEKIMNNGRNDEIWSHTK